MSFAIARPQVLGLLPAAANEVSALSATGFDAVNTVAARQGGEQ
jgi:hypothetical protein